MDDNIDKLKKINEEITLQERQLKHLKEKTIRKKKQDERRKRAHRLIQTGALAEKYFELHNLSIEERESIFKMFATFINANKPDIYKK